MIGYGVGARPSGVRLDASCSPFDVIPPDLYQRFKVAVMEMGKQWGLKVMFGQDDGSIAQAEQRYWEMQRAHVNAAAKDV